ncbi:hypothetical protein AKJ09_03140 [Labilithrix luteola]|uniref:Uncharacterized protein n=1 Tax=Labilithrix luteola TaxID=1391654 RepID=A0A0K1PSX4_9BACT|nr:hypothetical protein AKJ09_03140 [Labilithrix luteola]
MVEFVPITSASRLRGSSCCSTLEITRFERSLARLERNQAAREEPRTGILQIGGT